MLKSALGQASAGDILWTYQADTWIQSSPSLGTDGTVYMTALGLCAITNSGSNASNKWIHPVGGTPAIGADGTIYCAQAGQLNAINPDGSKKWTFWPGMGSWVSLPAIGADGTVYYATAGRLYAVSASGSKKWECLLDDSGAYVQSPVVDSDGTIYLALGVRFYSFTPTGTNKWSRPLSNIGYDAPALGSGGIVYCGAGSLYAFSGDGTNLWSTSNYAFYNSPVVGTDGTIFAGAGGRSPYAISSAGTILWHVIDGPLPRYGEYTSSAIDAAGRIYHCVSNSIWCISSQGQVRWKITSPEPSDIQGDLANRSPIIGPDGTLYAAVGTRLYAVATGTHGPANSPWPMYRGNAQHTGRIQKASLQKPRRRADANFEFEVFSQAGKDVAIESSTNLSAWSAFTNLVPVIVPEPVVDLSASNFPVKFYRAKGGG